MDANEPDEKIKLKKAGALWRASYKGVFGQGKTTGRAYLNIVKRLYDHMQSARISDFASKKEAAKDAEAAKNHINQLKEKLAAEQKLSTSLSRELFEVRSQKRQVSASIEHTNHLRTENCRLIGENRELTKQINELTKGAQQ